MTLAQISDGLRVVKQGLAPEDRVVISGLTLLRPGAKVAPKEEAPARTPTAAGASASKQD